MKRDVDADQNGTLYITLRMSKTILECKMRGLCICILINLLVQLAEDLQE
jgi:hypothetical protein